MRFLLFFGLAAAIATLTRLLIKDEFPPVRVVREWFIRTFGEISPEGFVVGGKRWGILGFSLAYVWTCPWCMSLYAGLAVWALADWVTPLSIPYPWLILTAGRILAGWSIEAQSVVDAIGKKLEG